MDDGAVVLDLAGDDYEEKDPGRYLYCVRRGVCGGLILENQEVSRNFDTERTEMQINIKMWRRYEKQILCWTG